MLVISRDYALTLSAAALDADNPVVLWRNIVTVTNIVADTEDADRPASNLANPATHRYWQGGSPDSPASPQYLTITTDEVDPIDAVGIARHNFGADHIAISLEGFISGSWQTLVEEFMPANDSPILFRFEPQSLAQVRIKMAAGDDVPRAAVVYCGKLMIFERSVYAGTTPINYGRSARITNGRSESGEFLGRIVIGESRQTRVPLVLLSKGFWDDEFADFIAASKDKPFFYAWRPQTYPLEVGYCWMTNEPIPVFDDQAHLISTELQLGGTV